MKFRDTIWNGIAFDNAKILIVEDDEAKNISTLVCRIIVTEIRWQCPDNGLLGRRDEQILQILDVSIDLGGKIHTITRNLHNRYVSLEPR